MKAFFIFRTSASYPNEARTIKFSKKPEAIKELKSFIGRDIYFFDRECYVRSNKSRDSYRIIEKSTRKTIETKIVRCDVHDPVIMYARD